MTFPCLFLVWGLFSYAPPQSLTFSTDQFVLEIDQSGYLTGFQSKQTKKNYLPQGLPQGERAPLLSLVKGVENLKPTGFAYNPKKKIAVLKYANGAVAEVKIEAKGSYIRLELLSVNNRNGVEVAMWGPYPTTISKLIGETVGVVRDNDFAIGIQSLNINTIEGIPDDGDNAGGGSFYDPLPGQKLPESLAGKVGQPVSTDVNGDGDMPEYVRQYRGTAAVKKPYGSELRFYARDRRLPRAVKTGEQVQAVMPVNSDMVGSAIAIFGCAEPSTLDVIEKIELGEGLPHPILQGKWVKRSSKTSDAYMLYEGKDLDQCLVYARDLNFKLVHIGDVFKSWGHFGLDTKRFDGPAAIRAFTDKARKDGISVGIHTLTTFTQVHDPYVSPVPNDSLQISGSALLVKDVSPEDVVIEVKDPEPFKNPSGTRTIKIGKELISYKAVSASQPWQLTGAVRGQFKTVKASHQAGTVVDKLVNSGYGGFLPDIRLQDQYARRLAQVCNETGIDLMDFDGFEALDATGHGTFAENKFIDLWYKSLDRYRMTCGSNTSHYYWHIYSYMNWGEPWYSALRTSQVNYRIENQRYFERNLMPGMLGWFKLENEYRPEEIEWIQARSAGFNAGYLLRVDETIERNGFKNELFSAIKEWQKARRANAFSAAQRERFKNPKTEFHLAKRSETSWDLTPVTLHGGYDHKYRQVQTGEPVKSKFAVNNSDGAQPFQFYLTAVAVEGNKTATVSNIVVDLNDGGTIEINETLKAGDKIFCDGKRIVLCDPYWKVVKVIGQGSVPSWKDGSNDVIVKSEFADSQAPILKLEFKSLGKAELVGTEK